MYLEKIINCISDKKNREHNIIELFKSNGIDFKEYNGMILADWFTEDFYKLNIGFYKDEMYLFDGNGYDWNEKEKNKDLKLRLKIERGTIKLNRLKK